MSEDGRSRVKIQCPHCDEVNRVRLPRHLTLARMDESKTGESKTAEGKILRTQCGKCDETVRFHAPEGYSFQAKTSEAARHFAARYRYLTGRGGSITRGLKSAREAFRRSYFDR
jgi:phage FluMu protein Com